MNIVVLDGGTTNPGDLSWAPLEALGTLTVHPDTPPELVLDRAQHTQAVIVNRVHLTREMIDALPELAYIGTLSIGVNQVDGAAARERGIPLCNVPFYCVDTVAQHALSLLLCLCGQVHAFSDTVRGGGWDDAVAMSHTTRPMVELAGKKLGILGYGHIGAKMAGFGQALGMEVLVYSRTKKEAPGCRWVSLEELFAGSDVLSLHCPLTPETQGLVNRERLALMKPTALLTNTARGGLIDEPALAAALNQGRLAGAGLDVLAQEPPAADCPLLTAKHCVITPHIGWASREARARSVRTVAENLKAFLAGRPQNVANPYNRRKRKRTGNPVLFLLLGRSCIEKCGLRRGTCTRVCVSHLSIACLLYRKNGQKSTILARIYLFH